MLFFDDNKKKNGKEAREGTEGKVKDEKEI